MMICGPRRCFSTSYRESPELGSTPLVAHWIGLGKLYRRTGKREQAQEHLEGLHRDDDVRWWTVRILAGEGGDRIEGTRMKPA